MIHAFRKYFLSLMYQPGISFLLLGVACYVLALATPAKALLLPGLLLMLAACLWGRLFRRRISKNFIMIRSVPLLEGPAHWMIFEDPEKAVRKLPCRQILHSIKEDSSLMDELPSGSYATITHAAFLKRIRKSERVVLEDTPQYLYSSTLRSVLKKQTGGRCKKCTSPCPGWKTPPRKFFLIRFAVL